MTLTNKVAIVTGASRGIGRAIRVDKIAMPRFAHHASQTLHAERLGKEGAAVVVNYAGSGDAATAVVRSIESSGSKAVAIQADISKAEDVQHLFEQTVQQFGKIDALVNNAAWKPEDAPLAETSEADFNQAFAVNVRGTFLCLREAVKYLQKGGRIINFSSVVVPLIIPNQATYTATKAAVESLTRTLAKELAGREITVNAIAPGATNTEMFQQDKEQQDIEAVINMTPLKRLGETADIANVVLFLLSDQGGWINGQIIHCNGGIV